MAEDSYLPYFNQELDLNNLNGSGAGLIIREPKKVVVNQDLKIEETLNSVAGSLVGVFKEVTPKTPVDPNKPDYYALEKPLFIGLIVTGDGWVVSSLPDDIKEAFNTKNYLAITADRKVYRIDKINVLKDASGDAVFFRLAAANNLPVRKIAPRSELSLGQSLLVIDNDKNVWPTNLSSFKKSANVLSSDAPQAFLSLANNSEAKQRNSFIFNFAGELVAVIGADKDIVPAFVYNSYWQDLGQAGASGRPFLGVNYLDLSAVKILDANINKGALIYPGVDKVALVKNSPAALAGLLPGDIITWVNNQELTSENDLADLIAPYKAGDKVTLSYLRNGQEYQADIKLEELK
jgi:S1-C subfamily serine protease